MIEINPGMNWPAQHCQTKHVNVVRRLILHSRREGDVTGVTLGASGLIPTGWAEAPLVWELWGAGGPEH